MSKEKKDKPTEEKNKPGGEKDKPAVDEKGKPAKSGKEKPVKGDKTKGGKNKGGKDKKKKKKDLKVPWFKRFESDTPVIVHKVRKAPDAPKVETKKKPAEAEALPGKEGSKACPVVAGELAKGELAKPKALIASEAAQKNESPPAGEKKADTETAPSDVKETAKKVESVAGEAKGKAKEMFGTAKEEVSKLAEKADKAAPEVVKETGKKAESVANEAKGMFGVAREGVTKLAEKADKAASSVIEKTGKKAESVASEVKGKTKETTKKAESVAEDAKGKTKEMFATAKEGASKLAEKADKAAPAVVKETAKKAESVAGETKEKAKEMLATVKEGVSKLAAKADTAETAKKAESVAGEAKGKAKETLATAKEGASKLASKADKAAPAVVKETAKKAESVAGEAKEKAKEMLTTAKEGLAELAEKADKAAPSVAEKATKKVESVVGEAKEMGKEMLATAKEGVAELAEKVDTATPSVVEKSEKKVESFAGEAKEMGKEMLATAKEGVAELIDKKAETPALPTPPPPTSSVLEETWKKAKSVAAGAKEMAKDMFASAKESIAEFVDKKAEAPPPPPTEEPVESEAEKAEAERLAAEAKEMVKEMLATAQEGVAVVTEKRPSEGSLSVDEEPGSESPDVAQIAKEGAKVMAAQLEEATAPSKDFLGSVADELKAAQETAETVLQEAGEVAETMFQDADVAAETAVEMADTVIEDVEAIVDMTPKVTAETARKLSAFTEAALGGKRTGSGDGATLGDEIMETNQDVVADLLDTLEHAPEYFLQSVELVDLKMQWIWAHLCRDARLLVKNAKEYYHEECSDWAEGEAKFTSDVSRLLGQVEERADVRLGQVESVAGNVYLSLKGPARTVVRSTEKVLDEAAKDLGTLADAACGFVDVMVEGAQEVSGLIQTAVDDVGELGRGIRDGEVGNFSRRVVREFKEASSMLRQMASDISGDMVTGTSSIKQEAVQVVEKTVDTLASKSEYLLVRLFGTPSTGAKDGAGSGDTSWPGNLGFKEWTKKKAADGKK